MRMIELGPDGPEFAAGKLGLDTSQVSGAGGNGAQFPYGDISPMKPGDVGVPTPPPKPETEKIPFVANFLRILVEKAWGHPYGYFDALLANGFDEQHIFYKGQKIIIPARGKRSRMVQAAKWRRRFGSS